MKILIILLSLLFFGCSKPAVPKPLEESIVIVRIDGCEYIKNLTYPRSYVYTHKGNCDNHN
jgi:hypothetical protein